MASSFSLKPYCDRRQAIGYLDLLRRANCRSACALGHSRPSGHLNPGGQQRLPRLHDRMYRRVSSRRRRSNNTRGWTSNPAPRIRECRDDSPDPDLPPRRVNRQVRGLSNDDFEARSEQVPQNDVYGARGLERLTESLSQWSFAVRGEKCDRVGGRCLARVSLGRRSRKPKARRRVSRRTIQARHRESTSDSSLE